MEGKIITNQEDIIEKIKSFDINLYENKDSCLEGVDLNKVYPKTKLCYERKNRK